MTTPSDYRALEAARIALAAELSRVKHELRQERALRALPDLEPVIEFVRGDSDEDYAAHAQALATALRGAYGKA
ncbi:hypothetical protein [Microbacterium sp. NPDC056234]|uniref:hypothetical protein n=1 Tax=Microbacterium sp. NPDC056234 TaxID=3345757 RepID=UPI0035D9983C